MRQIVAVNPYKFHVKQICRWIKDLNETPRPKRKMYQRQQLEAQVLEGIRSYN